MITLKYHVDTNIVMHVLGLSTNGNITSFFNKISSSAILYYDEFVLSELFNIFANIVIDTLIKKPDIINVSNAQGHADQLNAYFINNYNKLFCVKKNFITNNTTNITLHPILDETATIHQYIQRVQPFRIVNTPVGERQRLNYIKFISYTDFKLLSARQNKDLVLSNDADISYISKKLASHDIKHPRVVTAP
jgi:hypothetical protein